MFYAGEMWIICHQYVNHDWFIRKNLNSLTLIPKRGGSICSLPLKLGGFWLWQEEPWVTSFCFFVCFVFDTCKHIDNVLRKPTKQPMKWLHVGVLADNDRKDLNWQYQGPDMREEVSIEASMPTTHCSCADSKSKTMQLSPFSHQNHEKYQWNNYYFSH